MRNTTSAHGRDRTYIHGPDIEEHIGGDTQTMETKSSQHGYEERRWRIERTNIDHKDYTAAAQEVSSTNPSTAGVDLWVRQIHREHTRNTTSAHGR